MHFRLLSVIDGVSGGRRDSCGRRDTPSGVTAKVYWDRRTEVRNLEGRGGGVRKEEEPLVGRAISVGGYVRKTPFVLYCTRFPRCVGPRPTSGRHTTLVVGRTPKVFPVSPPPMVHTPYWTRATSGTLFRLLARPLGPSPHSRYTVSGGRSGLDR